MSRRNGPEPPHGTTRRYWLRRAPCRCAMCRRAFADYMRAWRANRAGRPHQIPLDPAMRLDVAAALAAERTLATDG